MDVLKTWNSIPPGSAQLSDKTVQTAARQYQNWDAFRAGIRSAVAELRETQVNAR